MTKKFVDQEVAPLAQKTDVEDQFPNHLWTKFGELGLLGMTTPAKYGGSELNYTAHAMVME
jgi:isovaleryl-CoA dehydrogenase